MTEPDNRKRSEPTNPLVLLGFLAIICATISYVAYLAFGCN